MISVGQSHPIMFIKKIGKFNQKNHSTLALQSTSSINQKNQDDLIG